MELSSPPHVWAWLGEEQAKSQDEALYVCEMVGLLLEHAQNLGELGWVLREERGGQSHERS